MKGFVFEVRHKLFYLQMLAAQAQHRDAAHIRMIGISRQQRAQGCGILPGAPTSALVIEKPDPIYVFKMRCSPGPEELFKFILLRSSP